MIQTRADLAYYLHEDTAGYHYKKPTLADWLVRNEWWYIYHFLSLLRHTEYYLNNRDRSFFHRAMYVLTFLRYKRWRRKLNMNIWPNTFGPGLTIYHIARMGMAREVHAGSHVTLRPDLMVGHVRGGMGNENVAATIGDYATLSIGSMIFGNIRIGRGAIVGPGAVVLHHVPPYAIVLGNPAKVVGFNKTPAEAIEFEAAHYEAMQRTPEELLRSNYERYFLQRDRSIKQFTAQTCC